MADSTPTRLIPAYHRGRPMKNPSADGPTPETGAELKPDELSRLMAQDQITPDQERAARRLHRFMLALQKGGSPISRLQLPATTRRRCKSASPLDRLSAVDQQLWDKVYRPWAGADAKKLVCRRSKALPIYSDA